MYNSSFAQGNHSPSKNDKSCADKPPVVVFDVEDAKVAPNTDINCEDIPEAGDATFKEPELEPEPGPEPSAPKPISNAGCWPEGVGPGSGIGGSVPFVFKLGPLVLYGGEDDIEDMGGISPAFAWVCCVANVDEPIFEFGIDPLVEPGASEAKGTSSSSSSCAPSKSPPPLFLLDEEYSGGGLKIGGKGLKGGAVPNPYAPYPDP